MVNFVFVLVIMIALLIAFNVFGGALYDVRHTKYRHALAKYPYRRSYRRRPVVSVIVSTHNQAQVVERCLASLTTSSYRKLDIIVIDNGSRDHSRQTIRSFMVAHPSTSIRLIARRTSSPVSFERLLKKHQLGEIVFLLDGAGFIEKNAIKYVVQRFLFDARVAVVLPHEQVLSYPSISSVVQQFGALVGFARKKAHMPSRFYAPGIKQGVYVRPAASADAAKEIDQLLAGLMSRSEDLSVAVASESIIYRESTSVFTPLIGTKSWRSQYRRFINSRHSVSTLINYVEDVLWTASSLITVYFGWLAVHYRVLAPLAIVWSGIVFGLVCLVLAENSLPRTQKARMLILTPLALGLSVLVSLSRALLKIVDHVTFKKINRLHSAA